MHTPTPVAYVRHIGSKRVPENDPLPDLGVGGGEVTEAGLETLQTEAQLVNLVAASNLRAMGRDSAFLQHIIVKCKETRQRRVLRATASGLVLLWCGVMQSTLNKAGIRMGMGVSRCSVFSFVDGIGRFGRRFSNFVLYSSHVVFPNRVAARFRCCSGR